MNRSHSHNILQLAINAQHIIHDNLKKAHKIFTRYPIWHFVTYKGTISSVQYNKHISADVS